MAGWDHGGGFSVDASVGIAADDRPALERLLRYCARPCWASERLTQADDVERLIYAFNKPRPDGSWQLTLTPIELLDRLARFIPPPRRHLHRYHDEFAPHAALRAQVAARAGKAIAAPVARQRHQDRRHQPQRRPRQTPRRQPKTWQKPSARDWACPPTSCPFQSHPPPH